MEWGESMQFKIFHILIASIFLTVVGISSAFSSVIISTGSCDVNPIAANGVIGLKQAMELGPNNWVQIANPAGEIHFQRGLSGGALGTGTFEAAVGEVQGLLSGKVATIPHHVSLINPGAPGTSFIDVTRTYASPVAIRGAANAADFGSLLPLNHVGVLNGMNINMVSHIGVALPPMGDLSWANNYVQLSDALGVRANTPGGLFTSQVRGVLGTQAWGPLEEVMPGLQSRRLLNAEDVTRGLTDVFRNAPAGSMTDAARPIAALAGGGAEAVETCSKFMKFCRVMKPVPLAGLAFGIIADSASAQSAGDVCRAVGWNVAGEIPGVNVYVNYEDGSDIGDIIWDPVFNFGTQVIMDIDNWAHQRVFTDQVRAAREARTTILNRAKIDPKTVAPPPPQGCGPSGGKSSSGSKVSK